MASQVPILAYYIDGISETLEYNKTGFLVQQSYVELLARKLNYIIENKSYRDIIPHNAPDKVKKKFTHKITAKKQLN